MLQCNFAQSQATILPILDKLLYHKIMANYHLTVKAISRNGGRSCVAALAYRSAEILIDQRTGEKHDYRNKENVEYVEIVLQDNSPLWIQDIANECKTSRQRALQKLSDIFEAAEKRKDARVYREIEFALPRELTKEQNIAWAREFVHDTCVARDMLAIMNFHFDIDKKTGEEKPHCHVLLSTRELIEAGFCSHKQTDWDHVELVEEWREQYAQYQNAALKAHGFEERVDHRSYEDQGLEIDPQPKRGRSLLEMTGRGIHREKAELFDMVRLRNQFRILKNPELVFSIVTAKHSTFTRQDIAKVLNRYIDDADQFRILHDRLMGSKELIDLQSSSAQGESKEPVYTTREMLRTELGLMRNAEAMAAQQTHKVDTKTVDEVIANHNAKLAKYGGLSTDRDLAIRHMLNGEQISCVVGYAGAGKTTSLEAAKEGWEQAGYKVLGLAPTGRAARNIEACGIRSMTIHKFLLSQSQDREQISPKTIVVLDEAGMVDSRRFAELLSIVESAGAKIVPMGDGNQLQAIEAGPAFRLLTDRIHPAVLETVVRQQEDWQREATRLFGSEQAGKALDLYQEKGALKIVEDKGTNSGPNQLVDQYCLARQMSGRIWKEMIADYEQEHGKVTFDEIKFETLSKHQDFDFYQSWKGKREALVEGILTNYSEQKGVLEERGIDTKQFGKLAAKYIAAELGQKGSILQEVESILRTMSYENICDTRVETKQALVEAWARHRNETPAQSHLMLAFTNKDAASLNQSARQLMREKGEINGREFTYKTCYLSYDDFGKETRTYENKTFACGDRLLFTHNDKGLGVTNGTLGRIVKLDQNKITVKTDEAGKVVSFAPKLYPYIENGWATTIHKTQGVTVDHVKKLASFEEYRNLAYVGMSRHRHTLEIFGSSLDFWRDEKVVDRLSRVQEKLSGFDYLSGEKIEELMKEDTEVLWHEKKLQEGKDLLSAVKITALDVVGQILDHQKVNVGLDTLMSLDHSEEKRSSELFQEAISLEGEEGRLNNMRQSFEKKRLPFHQNWCSKMGFLNQHKRLPETAEEISTAFWQGERLTVIEGRLYYEALERGTEIKQDDFIQQARQELLKNQKAPDYIMAYTKASEFTLPQQEQFEQHVLLHRDKTGTVPEPKHLEVICTVITAHSQIRGQGSEIDINKSKDDKVASYEALIEQQAIIHRMGKAKDDARYESLNLHEVKEECAEKSQRFTEEVQMQNNLSQSTNRLVC
jgi:Ti-type conjugative transfer relaxase TraA